METITGTAAGVPFTALPPTDAADGPAPLVMTWHMLDAPRTDLPLTGVTAWRVHLGMPMCGARMVDGRVDAVIELVRTDAVTAFSAPFVHQAADEFPPAVAALRDQLPVDDGPIGVLGGSLGGAVALQLDFVTRAADPPDPPPPLLFVSGERDHPLLRTDAAALVDALRARSAHPDEVELTTVPDLAHPLADEPGLDPAPQRPVAKAVDEILTRWFLRWFPAR